MSNRLLTDDRGAEIVEAIRQNTVAQIKGKEGLKVTSYADVQEIVRMGLAPAVFSIGDVIEVSKESAVTASLGEHTGITAVSVDEDKFVAKMNETAEKEYEFIFDGSVWKYEDQPVILANYGISVTGTAKKDDVFFVVETASTVKMVVMGFIDNNKQGAIKIKDNTKKYGMILQSADCFYNAIQFDAPEAFLYCENGLAAGTYNITMGTDWGTNVVSGKTYQFTLTKAVPAGGQLAGFLYMPDRAPSTWQVMSYDSPSAVTATETVNVTEGNAGTSLGTFLPAGDPAHGLNSMHRIGYGNNRWRDSAMRQFLNNAGTANFWAPQHNFDRAPLSNTPGWMHGLDPEFIKICADVELETVLNTVCDTTSTEASAGTGFDVTVDKFFLPARTEVYGGKENNSDHGVAWPYYSENSDLNAPGGDADTNRIKFYGTTARYWWFRSPNVGNAYSVRSIYPSGNVNGYYAGSSVGVAPACIVA